jgi:hypothetical protein
MAHIILGTDARPQVVDTEAIKVVEVVKRSSMGSQLVVRNERGTALGVWTPPPRSARNAKHTDAQKTQLAQQMLREVVAIVRQTKPKTQRDVHNFTDFVLESEVEPPASEPEPEVEPEQAAESTQ